MNHCPHCGKQLDTAGSFCPYCGKALSAPDRTHKGNDPRLKRFLGAAAVILVTAAILAVILLNKPFSDDLDAIDRSADSLVTIYTYDPQGVPIANGSGFAALDTELIVTNYHVIEGNTYKIECVTDDGTAYTTDSIVCYDAERDIAILRAAGLDLPQLPMGDSETLRKGEKVTAIGISNLVSTGVFSSYLTRENGFFHILFTASISPGSSGGALLNENGEVVGITGGAYTAGNDLYCAIPLHFVRALYDSRSPDGELTVEDHYDSTDHTYSPDAILAAPTAFVGQTVTLCGYVSAVDGDLYLVSSPDSVLRLDTRGDDRDSEAYLEKSMAIYDQYRSGGALRVTYDLDMQLTDSVQPGGYAVITGRVMAYSDSGKTDVRFAAEEGIVTNE